MGSDPVTKEFCDERHKSTEQRLDEFAKHWQAQSLATTEALAAIAGGVGAMRAEIRSDIDAATKSIDSLNKGLYRGNGQPGIVSVVAEHGAKHDAHSEAIADLQSIHRRNQWFMVTTIVGAAATVLLTHFLAG